MIVAAVNAGTLDIKVLDAAAIRLVELALRTHSAIQAGASFDKDAHHALARKVAGQAAVLLKNNGVLPLAVNVSGRTAVIGRFAQHARYQGAGSSQVNPTKLDRPFDELAMGLGGDDRVVYAAGYEAEGETSDALLAEAVAAAKSAQRAIVFVGLPDSYESEGFDRKSLDLPAGHNALVSAVAAVQPDTIVVLMNGAPVALPWIDEVSAVLEAYLGGQAGGGAIADLLTGKVNPSGKLAETFPVRLEDTPTYPNFPGRDGVALYGEGLFIGYRYYDAKQIEPLFPFGFGLSYTQFAYDSIKAASTEVGEDCAATIEVTVRNTGKRAGAEIVQLYVHEQSPKVVRPEQELKAFSKITLAPGESRVVTFNLSSRDFAHYDPRVQTWVVDAGAYEIRVGGSSRDLPLNQVLNLAGTPPVLPKLTPDSSLAELSANPRGKPIYDEMINGMLGQLKITDDMTEEQAAVARKTRNTILGFINEMPLKKLVRASQGRFTEERMHEILKAVNQE
jgi:beta-glucosidase